MKKRFGAIVAASVMSCAMVAGIAASGCTPYAQIYDFEMPDAGYDGGKVTITFASTMGQKLIDVLDEAIPRFNAIYPNITVKTDVSNKSYDGLASSITTKLTTGRQPNVAFCYSDNVAVYNSSKAVLALDEFFLPGSGYEDKQATTADGKEPLGLTQDQVNDYVKEFYAEGSVFGDGHVYTIPFAKSTEVLYYNQDKFDKYNLKVPETWEEMEALCEQILTLDEMKDTKCYPLSYDSEANWFITMCEQYGSGYTSATGDHFLFDNQKNKDFVKMLCDWYSKGYFITKGTNADTFTSGKFTKEECFMSIGSTGGSSYQDPGSTDGQMKFQVGVAPIPQVDKDHPKSILQGPSVCIFKKQDPQEVLASWLLVKFLTTEIQFQARYSETSGYMPVTYSAINDEGYQEFLTETGLTAKTAKPCIDLIGKDAYFTSDAFYGSSTARERVEVLMKSALQAKGTNIDQAFEDAIDKCNRFVKGN